MEFFIANKDFIERVYRMRILECYLDISKSEIYV